MRNRVAPGWPGDPKDSVYCDGQNTPKWRYKRDNRIRRDVGAALMDTKKRWRPGEYKAIMRSMLSPTAFEAYNHECERNLLANDTARIP